MSKIKRLIYLLILSSGLGLSYLLINKTGMTEKHQVSFVPILKVVGTVPQTLDRSLSRVMPIDGMDEGQLGDIVNSQYDSEMLSEADAKKERYLNKIMKDLQTVKLKPFGYRVHLFESSVPNAMALPGGVILVTKGMMEVVKSESELAAVLAHEMGHIELSHCFDSVKYEILMKKVDSASLGVFADQVNSILLRHSFSKNQEDEADEYAYNLILAGEYDPASVFKVFKRLNTANMSGDQGEVNPFRDYFSSHPSLESRISKFHSKASQWWTLNPSAFRYEGIQNLLEMVNVKERRYAHEAVKSFKDE
jgi:predicted Zn-dependent protease